MLVQRKSAALFFSLQRAHQVPVRAELPRPVAAGISVVLSRAVALKLLALREVIISLELLAAE